MFGTRSPSTTSFRFNSQATNRDLRLLFQFSISPVSFPQLGEFSTCFTAKNLSSCTRRGKVFRRDVESPHQTADSTTYAQWPVKREAWSNACFTRFAQPKYCLWITEMTGCEFAHKPGEKPCMTKKWPSAAHKLSTMSPTILADFVDNSGQCFARFRATFFQ